MRKRRGGSRSATLGNDMTFEEVWGSVVALREAVAAGYVKPGKEEKATLALAAEIDRLRVDAVAALSAGDVLVRLHRAGCTAGYEQGVQAAIRWMQGDSRDSPMAD